MPVTDLKARSARVLRKLKKLFPDAPCALVYATPLELLVATVLSAQCTDVRVNLVTRDLFRRYRSAADFARAPLGELEEAIRSTGFFRSKARSIQGLARALVERHGGEVPEAMEDLVVLPGVGRKTANVVLGEAYGIASGIVVDTHVKRISTRLGLTKEDHPEKIEQDLMRLFPRKEWLKLGMRMILHGRGLCPARKPRCGECPLVEDCPFGAREVAARAAPAGTRRAGRSAGRAAGRGLTRRARQG